jgi:hypothetical protein
MTNEVNSYGGIISNIDVIKNVLVTLPNKYSDKVSIIEEIYDPNTFTKEQLFGTLTTFQMRKFAKVKEKTESTFKATKAKADLDHDPNELEAKFTRKLKKGISKYKGMLLLCLA